MLGQRPNQIVISIFPTTASKTIEIKQNTMNKFRLPTAFILLYFLSLSTYGQVNGPNANDVIDQVRHDSHAIYQENVTDSLITWREQLLFHFDNHVLEEDTPLFFKAYTLTGPNKIRATLSKVLKVELLDEENAIIKTQYHKIVSGMAEGSIIMPKKLKDGQYTLRAYTRWMQNYGEDAFFQQRFLVSSQNIKPEEDRQSEDILISFYPEGGTLVHGLKNRLVVKATGSANRPVEIEGVIVDGSGDEVAVLTDHDKGLASTFLSPVNDEPYYLMTKSGKKYLLPQIAKEGAVLNINNLDENKIKVRVSMTDDTKAKKVLIRGIKGGIVYFDKPMPIKQASGMLDISKVGLPLGTMTFLLLDEKEQVLAFRPIEITAANQLNISVDALDQDLSNSELVLKLRVTDDDGNPVRTNVSLSAVNLPTDFSDKESNSFEPLMNDNMVWGDIQRQDRFLRDLQAMTMTNSTEGLMNPELSRIDYPFQKGLNLYGYAYDLNNKLLKNSKIQMVNTSKSTILARELTTDKEGRIRIENLDVTGENDIVFRTYGGDAAARLVKIVPFENSVNGMGSTKTVFDATKKNKADKKVQSPSWLPIDNTDVIALSEVEIKQNKLKRQDRTPSLYGIEPTKSVLQDFERPKTIPELFLGIAGVQVIGLGGLRPSIRLTRETGSGPILWVVNRTPLSQPTTLVDIMDLIPANDVDRIEILQDSEASMYGSRAAGGVVLLYTRNASSLDNIKRKDGQLKFQGYEEVSDFKSFAQQLAKKPKKFQDKRTTLYWNPNIQTDENGEAMIRFTTPLSVKQLEIKTTAITEKGAVGSARISL